MCGRTASSVGFLNAGAKVKDPARAALQRSDLCPALLRLAPTGFAAPLAICACPAAVAACAPAPLVGPPDPHPHPDVGAACAWRNSSAGSSPPSGTAGPPPAYSGKLWRRGRRPIDFFFKLNHVFDPRPLTGQSRILPLQA